jgi:hypothetical protein
MAAMAPAGAALRGLIDERLRTGRTAWRHLAPIYWGCAIDGG